MEKKPVTRRDFVRMAGVAAGASILAACGPAATPETVIVKETVISEVEKEVVKEVEKVVTATAAPTEPPEPVVLDVWFNTNIPDLNAEWTPDPENPEFQKQWYFGGLGRQMFIPWLEAHPGVSMNITSHSWDWDLRQNQLMALAAGIYPDTTYGEAYVNEFVQLGVFNTLSNEVAALFPEGTYGGATIDGKVYGLPKSSGTNVLFVNLDKVAEAGQPTDKLPTTWEELVALAQAISTVNKSEKWGNTAYYTYGPGGDSYGQAMRILQWFNQKGVPLGSNVGVPSANTPGAAEVWMFHNDLMWSSSESLILQAESEAGSGQLFNDGVIALKPGWNNDATSVGAGNVNAVGIPLPLPAGGVPANIVIGNDMHSPLKGGKNPDLAVTSIEETLVVPETQAWLADNCGIWIPALKSLLEQYPTYDKLAGYKTDIAKNIVRATMQALLEGGAGPLPGWPKNGSRIWTEWNSMYGRIWKEKMDATMIQAELDKLQTTIEGLVAKSG
jgi:ABC-type glycerol-3-phosphate transport system substrate-binding protein